jgi:5-methylcytosine-specific restriction protein A
MPSKLKKPCAHPGCPELTDGRYCDKHQKKRQQEQDQRRGTAAQRGYDYRWQKYRVQFLKRNPLCVMCKEEGRVTPASVVDHVKPHKGNRELFWATWNHQSLCPYHHNIKTASEDGGWGNR